LFLVPASLLFGCETASPDGADTFTHAGLKSGSVMTREACRWPDSSIWLESKGECIRYFQAGLAADQSDAGLEARDGPVHVWFHGDRLINHWGRNRARTVEVAWYQDNDPGILTSRADREFRTYGIPYIRFSRPGVYGSSGDHQQRRRPREIEIIDATLDRLRERYGIKLFVFSGQSGGGHVIGSLLSMRSDIECAVITSGSLAVRMRLQLNGWNADSTGYNDFFDPIDHVAEIPNDPSRRIFVIADPQDETIPFSVQYAYYKALKNAGHNAWLIRANGRGKQHHGLSHAGFKVARWCAQGLPTEDILAMSDSL
jgi:predicted esterase